MNTSSQLKNDVLRQLIRTTQPEWVTPSPPLDYGRSGWTPAVWLGILAAICWLLGHAAPSVAAHRASALHQPRNESAAAEKVLLDLSKKETFILLSVNADPHEVRITDVLVKELPTAYQLVPAAGTARLGAPLDIQLKKPANVRIRLAVVKRGKDLALRISPQIVFGQDDSIELTQDRITRSARKFHRCVKDLSQQLTALARERQALDFWLSSPGNKPLSSVKVVRMRIKVLGELIKARQREIPVAQSRCAALNQAAAFVKTLHKNVEICYTVKIVPSDESEGEGAVE